MNSSDFEFHLVDELTDESCRNRVKELLSVGWVIDGPVIVYGAPQHVIQPMYRRKV